MRIRTSFSRPFRARMPVLALLLALLLGGCAAAPEQHEASMREHELGFDPAPWRSVRSDSGHARTRAETPADAPAERASSEPVPVTMEPATPERQIMGWRVQVFSSTSLEEAERIRNEYRQFLDPGMRIDLVFDAPSYKVRAGEFPDRKEAEQLRDQLRARGITQAWIVRDRITLKRRQDR